MVYNYFPKILITRRCLSNMNGFSFLLSIVYNFTDKSESNNNIARRVMRVFTVMPGTDWAR